MEKIRFEQLPELFESVGELFAAKKDELCAMDAKLGDGDLGLTMSKGFAAVPDFIRAEMETAPGDCGRVLMKAGMKMSSLIPSTMGFLMSSGMMEGGKAVKGLPELDGIALARFLEGFAAGIQKRGKCQVGQRTVYDSIKPAADAALACESVSASDVIGAALKGAEDGLEATKGMTPIFGKAAVHAAQSVGIADQGATAGYYLILGLSNYIFQ